MLTTRDMSDRHERRLADRLGGRMTKASGSQWNDQGDGRRTHGAPMAYCWDGKSTKGQSIMVTREMWRKITEQAHWGRPMLGLGFFTDERLSDFEASLIVVSDDDFAELLDEVDQASAVRARMLALAQLAETGHPVSGAMIREVALGRPIPPLEG
jgi:hypothetical protein